MELSPDATDRDRFYRRTFVLVTCLALAVALYRILAPFLGPMLWAAFLAFLLHPLHVRLTRAFRNRPHASAFVLTFAVLILFLGPLGAMAAAFAAQVGDLLQTVQSTVADQTRNNVFDLTKVPWVASALSWLDSSFGINVSQVRGYLIEGSRTVLQSLASLGGKVFLGAFGAVYAGGAAGAAANKLNPAPAAPPAEETKAAAEKKQEAAKEKLAAAEQKQKDVEKKVEKAEGEKKVADTKLAEKASAEKEAAAAAAKAPADAALASALKLTQTEASAAKTVAGAAKQSVDTAKEELKTATEATTAARAAFEAAAKAVEKAGAALMQIGSDYAKIAEGYRQEKQEYLKMLMDKQDMEQELLASIQEYAVKMQHTGTSIQTVQLT